MKSILRTLLCAIAVIISATGCENLGIGMTWDISPVLFSIKATDGTHDLFDPEYQDNIIGQVSVTYEEKEYMVEQQSKAYYAPFEGLIYVWDGNSHKLEFGQFAGDTDYVDMTLTINWPDGSKDVVVYNRNFKWGLGGAPKVKESTTINGKEGTRLIERRF